jgi:putative addiction module component (TIGR02574 family)
MLYPITVLTVSHDSNKLSLNNKGHCMDHTSISDIIRLRVPERLQLVEDIWDSITELPESVPLTDDQKKELDRRLVEYKLHPETGVLWDRVKEKI